MANKARQNQQTSWPDRQIIDSLTRLKLLENPDAVQFERLTGGISSDIWKVTTPDQTFCVKRALPQLRVEEEWAVSVERNKFEVAWCHIANNIVSSSAPRILAHDESAKLCVMTYLDPQNHKLWKNELRDGRADLDMATLVGTRLCQIHRDCAGKSELERQFPQSTIFRDIRLSPYLEATADKHPDLAEQLFFLSERTANINQTLIHGDISPKNILLGPDGPVFLDAECACLGDPAFDLAFCLKHFLLKCLWTPSATEAFIASFTNMSAAYLQQVDWETVTAFEKRAATLLPGLFLARVDGKSPVEYIIKEEDRDKVRRCARALLFEPTDKLSTIAEAWYQEVKE